MAAKLSSAGLHSTTYLYWFISGTLRSCYVTICSLTPMSKDIYVYFQPARIPRPWSNTVPPRTVLQRTILRGSCPARTVCQNIADVGDTAGGAHITIPLAKHELYFRRSRDRSQGRLRPVSRVSTWNLHRASVKRKRPCGYKYLRIYKSLYFRLQKSQDHGPTRYLLSQPCRERS